MPQRSVRFPDELAAAVERMASEHERSFSWIVVKAVEAFVPDGYRETPRRPKTMLPTPERLNAMADEGAAVARLPKSVPTVRRGNSDALARQARLNKEKGL